ENRLVEFSFAIAVENPGCRLGIVYPFIRLVPFGHFGGENIQVAVTINVSNLQTVAVNHLVFEQIMSHPVLAHFGIARAFVPPQRPNSVAWSDDYLGEFSRLEFACAYSPTNRANLDRLEFLSPATLKP